MKGRTWEKFVPHKLVHASMIHRGRLASNTCLPVPGVFRHRSLRRFVSAVRFPTCDYSPTGAVVYRHTMEQGAPVCEPVYESSGCQCLKSTLLARNQVVAKSSGDS